MSKQYSDAEKAEYWRKRAKKAKKVKKGYKSDAYYKYKANERALDRREKRQDRDPGVISAIGSAIGGAFGTEGGPIGTALGGFLGGKLGHLVEKITGFGDYKVHSNTIMSGGMSNAQVVNSSANGGTIVRHREYIGDVKSTTTFTLDQFPLNPGQNKTFPWLSTIAANFEQYRFRGVLFEFHSTSADNVLSSAASTALGTVSMSTDYDVLDTPYLTKREMLNAQYANSRKPSESFIHPVECKKAWTPYNLNWVRTTNTFPDKGDPRTYDLGNFYVATEGMQNASSEGTIGSIGELWVTYEVEFFKQQLLPVGFNTLADHLLINLPTSANWLGNNTSAFDPKSTLGGTATSNTYIFPPEIAEGLYLVVYDVFGTSASLGEINVTLSNCQQVDVWNGGATLFLQSPGSGISSASIMCSMVVKLLNVSASITFNTANIPTAGYGDLWITELPLQMGDTV